MPDGPLSRGHLCVRGELGLMRTYDHTRYTGPMKRVDNPDGSISHVAITWEEGMSARGRELRANPGKAFFLGGHETGTSRRADRQALAAFGSPDQRLRFEPYAYEALRSADELVFGTCAVSAVRVSPKRTC